MITIDRQFTRVCTSVLGTLLLTFLSSSFACAEEGISKHETDAEVISQKLHLEVLEKELEAYLKAGGKRGSKQYEKLFPEIVHARQELARLLLEHRESEKARAEHKRKTLGQQTKKELVDVKKQIEIAKQHLERKTAISANEQAQLKAILQSQVARLQQHEAEKNRLVTELQKAHQELKRRREASSHREHETLVFRLHHVQAAYLAEQLITILGHGNLRVAPDSRTNSLVISGNREILDEAQSMIKELDRASDAESQTKDRMLPHTLMVRVFWLSDGRTSKNTQELASNYLPSGVISALSKVGLDTPYIVLQGNSSVASKGSDAVTFEIDYLPALVFGERLTFSAQGQITSIGTNLINMFILTGSQVREGQEFYSENSVRGSLEMPLDHYIILGTANYAPLRVSEDSPTTRFAYVVQVVKNESIAPVNSSK